jgi:hypothetical protein
MTRCLATNGEPSRQSRRSLPRMLACLAMAGIVGTTPMLASSMIPSGAGAPGFKSVPKPPPAPKKTPAPKTVS